jgi:hypothetical protein
MSQCEATPLQLGYLVPESQILEPHTTCLERLSRQSPAEHFAAGSPERALSTARQCSVRDLLMGV